jgi:hypothetical protein
METVHIIVILYVQHTLKSRYLAIHQKKKIVYIRPLFPPAQKIRKKTPQSSEDKENNLGILTTNHILPFPSPSILSTQPHPTY